MLSHLSYNTTIYTNEYSYVLLSRMKIKTYSYSISIQSVTETNTCNDGCHHGSKEIATRKLKATIKQIERVREWKKTRAIDSIDALTICRLSINHSQGKKEREKWWGTSQQQHKRKVCYVLFVLCSLLRVVVVIVNCIDSLRYAVDDDYNNNHVLVNTTTTMLSLLRCSTCCVVLFDLAKIWAPHDNTCCCSG